MVDSIIQNKIAAAIRTEDDFSIALKSKVDVVFLLHSNIMTIDKRIEAIHEAGKKALIHLEFAEGVGKDRAGIDFLATKKADGILTTRTNIVRLAKEFGLITVQRFFLVDSHSLNTSVESIRISKPDIIELMPGIVTKKIKEFSQIVDMPIVAGGIIETRDEVVSALQAGADVVSTGEKSLWDLNL